MSKQIKLMVKIERLRSLLHELILEKGNLLHEKIIKVSQELDKVLNEFNKRVVSF